MNESLRAQISDLLARNRIVLFMKGDRRSPQCGFSAQVVQILDGLVPEYETVNVLSSPELRDGIKEFSQWPTIPQLYVAGQFVGGCDIVRDLSSSGELAKLLGAEESEPAPPVVTITPSARKAFEAALSDANGDPLHLQVGPQFQYDLYFGPPEAGDLEVTADGLKLFIDRSSRARADGVSIDFVEGAGGGFKIENPNEPPKVRELSVVETKAMLDRGELTLFDVRPEGERALAKLSAARSLDTAGQAYLMGLAKSTPIALHCHHGGRSRAAGEQLLRQGFTKVYNVQGGIDAWSMVVDPSIPRY
jgi:monothiol glutaredoxin